jgi:hypothetical protein
MANYEVTPEANKIIKEYAERVGKAPQEALVSLIVTAHSRKESLRKYAEANPRPAKVKTPKEKKAKVAKAKGSLAKKVKAAKKAPKAKKQDFSAAEEAMEKAQAKADAKFA